MTAIHLQPYRGTPRTLGGRHHRLDALSDAAGRIVATLSKWRRRSHERAELAALDDRMLRDIGLSKGEAEFLANKPFWKD